MERWRSKTLQSWLVRAAAVAIPLVASVAAAVLATKVLPRPTDIWEHMAWWALVVGVSILTLVLVTRLARKLLPLSVLLSLSLAFPGEAPSRFRIAARAWSSATVARQVEAAKKGNGPTEAVEAAEFLLTLVASLGAHDARTRGHAARTRAYTDLIAEELKLPQVDIERLRWVSLLHDIGKLAVPSSVLRKDGALDEGDWSHLHHHPSVGYELTRPLHEFLGGWELVILHHHERYDGTGYPKGLRGDEIAFGARVVSVADSFDAMTASRSYQKPMSAAAARKELAYRAGTQFDPMAVRAFLNVSTSRMHRIIGPLAALATVPLVSTIRRAGQNAAVATAAVASMAVMGVTGVVELPIAAAGPTPSGDGASQSAIVLSETIEAPAFAIDVAAFDPTIDPASVAVVNSPASVEAVDNGDGTITIRPQSGFAGVIDLEIEACTVAGSCSIHNVELLVDLAGSPKLLAAPPGMTARALPGAAERAGSLVEATPSTTATTAVPTTTTPTTTTVPATTTTVPVVATTATTTTTTTVPVTTTTVPVTTTTTTTVPVTTTTVPVTTTTTTVPVTTTTVPVTTTTTTTTTTVPVTTTTVPVTTTTTTTVPVTTTTIPATTTTTTTVPDDQPSAGDDAVATDEDTPLTIDVLANDTDEDLASIVITVTSQPSAGSATVVGSEVLFTPATDDAGNRHFDYEICDTGGQCDSARVDVTITPVNDAPVAAADSGETELMESARVKVLDNDTDVDGDQLRVDVALSDTISALGGTVDCTKNGDKECEYGPPAGWDGAPDTFTYVVTDDNGGTAAATVTITGSS